MARAELSEGLKTTIDYVRGVVCHQEFLEGIDIATYEICISSNLSDSLTNLLSVFCRISFNSRGFHLRVRQQDHNYESIIQMIQPQKINTVIKERTKSKLVKTGRQKFIRQCNGNYVQVEETVNVEVNDDFSFAEFDLTIEQAEPVFAQLIEHIYGSMPINKLTYIIKYKREGITKEKVQFDYLGNMISSSRVLVTNTLINKNTTEKKSDSTNQCHIERNEKKVTWWKTIFTR